MVDIDGTGNRLAAICYGPNMILVVAGMNKVEDTLEAAINRASTVAAPRNKQRFANVTPCDVTGSCRPIGRIKFILVGEGLGM